jgi:hypothetical protein
MNANESHLLRGIFTHWHFSLLYLAFVHTLPANNNLTERLLEIDANIIVSNIHPTIELAYIWWHFPCRKCLKKCQLTVTFRHLVWSVIWLSVWYVIWYLESNTSTNKHFWPSMSDRFLTLRRILRQFTWNILFQSIWLAYGIPSVWQRC